MEVIESGTLGGQEDWQRIVEVLRSIEKMEHCETSGKVSSADRRETWWWNEEAQEKLKHKRKAKKVWDTIRNYATNLAYKTARKQAKKDMAKVRNKAYEKLYKKLETKKGKNELFEIAKQRKQGCAASKSNQE